MKALLLSLLCIGFMGGTSNHSSNRNLIKKLNARDV